MTSLMGSDTTELTMQPGKAITVIMMCGLQGAGKTTTTAKIAGKLKQKGKRPLLVACDVYRPAAIKQLQVVGAILNIPVYANEGTKDVVEKHVNNIKKNNPDLKFEPTVCYFFKKDANFEKFKTDNQKAHYKEIVDVLEAQTDMLSEAAILEIYENCTSHLEKRKK